MVEDPHLIYAADKGFVVGRINATDRHRGLVRGISKSIFPDDTSSPLIYCTAAPSSQVRAT